ncbi:MAG: HipA family kinase [Cyanobacteria bacterium P01_A01_bin.68]
MINLTKFYQEIRNSSSLPLLVEGDDGVKYVIKLRGGADGAIANIIEWLSLQFARLIQIPALTPELLIVDADLVQQVDNAETRDIVEKSIGINFGTIYIENAKIFDPQDVSKIDDRLKSSIFLYDLFLLNIDRTFNNSNMIYDCQNQLLCFDYTSSMMVRFVLMNLSHKYSDAFGKQIKKHPFYHDQLSVDHFVTRVDSVSSESILEIIKEIPDTWLTQLNLGNDFHHIHNTILNNLLERINQVRFMDENLKLLKNISLESEEQRKVRVYRNKQLFIDKFGKL